MRHNFFIFSTILFIFSTGIFAKDVKRVKNKTEPVYLKTNNSRPQLFRSSVSDPVFGSSTRQEFDLITDDFEGDVSGWEAEGGWELTNTDFNSSNSSFRSPDQVYYDTDGVTPIYRVWDLTSPIFELPLIGDGESMHFSFYVNVDLPDANQEDDPATPDEDESTYLADFYYVQVMDTENIAWAPNDFNPSGQNADGGNSYRCAKDDIGANGGYLSDWVQYMDTPTFTVPDNGVMTADMYWALEPFVGVLAEEIACTGGNQEFVDGWDQGNVQISVNGGESFTIIEGSIAYDFQCGYGMVNNGFDGGAGWGGYSNALGENANGWNNISFDLSQYAGQDAIVRFAFYSDPGWDTTTTSQGGGLATGFQVDNIVIGSDAGAVFSDDADTSPSMIASGSVWEDVTYDYYETCYTVDGTTITEIEVASGEECTIAGGEYRPGSYGWEEYGPNDPFGEYMNLYMEITDLAGKDVRFRFQSYHDEDTSGGQGEGLFIDDLRIFKISGGNYPSPTGLVAASGDEEVVLSWDDMNFSGQVSYQYDNDSFDLNDAITLSSDDLDAFAWVGNKFNVAGSSTVESVSIYNVNPLTCDVEAYGGLPVDVDIAAFGTFGTLFSTNIEHTQSVQLTDCGWNTFNVNWPMNGPFIIGHTFSGSVSAAVDATASPSQYSMSFLNSTWDVWSDDAIANALPDGEWGIRASVNQQGAGVTYKVYRDGGEVVAGLSTNSYTDMFVANNVTYSYQIAATYDDGQDSEVTAIVEATPLSQTVHEVFLDDGTYEDVIDFASTGELLAVKFNALSSGEELTRFKWYQESLGGGFFIKIWADDNGVPGAELFSKIVAGADTGLDGWNEKDLSGEYDELLSGDFWAGIRSLSSTKNFGIDNSSSGSTYYKGSSSEEWSEVATGNAMIRLFLDDLGGGESCISGDVNGNTTVEVSDIVLMVNYILGTMTPDDQQTCAADANGDGSVAVNDIVLVINIILGS
tara:strand:+ start:15130 stop:18051 length:2922 start_codon:yes stop_codon:yes gene_type:complete